MSRIPEFLDHLSKMERIHVLKNQDYADASNPFENFDRSAEIISWFKNPKDQAYAALIATKLARLANLLNQEYEAEVNCAGKFAPKNEPVDDSFLDLNTYQNLWWCNYEWRKKGKTDNLTHSMRIMLGFLNQGEVQVDTLDNRKEGTISCIKCNLINPYHNLKCGSCGAALPNGLLNKVGS